MATNYASILGIQNKWAPILFAVLYFIIMIWYLIQAVRKRAFVYAGLALFSAMRVVSFSLRAAIASNHHNAAFNRQMATAYEILYNIGFFSLLLSAYRLLHDRRRLAQMDKARNGLQRALSGLHRGRFVELLLLAAIVLGAVGGAFALGTDTGRTRVGDRLTSASTYILLAVTLFVVLLTFLLISLERALRRTGTPSPLGASSHHALLVFIALLLLLRILYFAATVHQRANGQPTPASQASSTVKQTAQANEHLWYPLAALAELLAVLLFLSGGLVPLRAMFANARRGAGGYANGNEKAPGMGAGAGPGAGGVGAPGGVHNGAGAAV
ncbi:hypothetical protein B0H17DRAFT_1137211 [Mycena rosella]|uniref:DUF7702 domain-containing protein n=1 Tax=Mycena rosella TaxID=1033263 RepID=A0AAD7GDP4_MYCRO|nr:hypothetical protein B0H17DRAFT_1137211 [Mycena rosella]